MAIVATPLECSLRLTLQVGTGEDGQPVYRVRTFNRVKPEATDEDVFAVARALAQLQIHPLAAVTRVSEKGLQSTA